MQYRLLFTQGRAPLSLAMLLSLSMVSLDVLLINTAMPSLLKDLGGLPFYSWTLGAYSLGNFAMLPIFSVLVSKWGGRISLSIASVFFALGALIGTQSPSMEWIFVARLLMGFGGGGFLAIPFGLINRHFSHQLKPIAIGALSSVWALAALGGPALGGLILEKLGWRWIFGLHLPLTLGLWLLSLIALKKEGPPESPQSKVNYLSSLIFASLSALLLYFFDTDHIAWPAFLAFPLLLVFFYFWEKNHTNPVLPIKYWKQSKHLRKVFLAMALSALAFGGAEGYLPLSLQGIWGYSPLEAGLILTTGSLSWSSTALLLPKFYGNRLRSPSQWGTLCLLVSMLLLILVHHLDLSGWSVYLSFLLSGLGMGLIVPTYNTLALDESSQENESAKGSMLLAMTWGFSLGPPLVGLAAQIGFGQSFQAQDLNTGSLSNQALQALSQGLQFALMVSTVLLLLSLALIWTLPKNRQASTH
ncbi:MAG: MFS transporter [Deltaproteobacteria bacterium]|nr:MFS transporter [Deltaproteobacteria bacterium]